MTRSNLASPATHLFLIIFFFVLSLSVTQALANEWRVTEEVNEATGAKRVVAAVTNSRNHTFTLYINPLDNGVWANFSLPENVLDYISPLRPPAYRIDKNKPIQPEVFEWYPKWFNFLVWDRSDGGPKIGAELRQIMEGKQLKVKYQLDAGEVDVSDFTLQGAAEAITQALHIQR